MDCPICKIPLQMSEKQGIEIDYCPQCRGIWLDRWELEKIIEKTNQHYTPTSQPQYSAPSQPQPRYEEKRPEQRDYENNYNRQDDYKKNDNQYHSKKKKWGFLEDIFDFG